MSWHARAALLLAGWLLAAPLTGAAELPDVDSAWDFQDPAASESRFRSLVTRGRDAADAAYVAEALTQLARSIGLQRRFDEARAVLDEAASLIGPDMQRAAVRLELERGRVTNSAGDPGGSITTFEQALRLAQAGGFEYLAVDAAHMLGIVTTGEQAIRWNERAIAMAETADSERARGWLGALYNNLAWTYNDLGRHEEALVLFEKDVALRKSQGRRFEASIALWSKAKTLRLLGRPAEALAIQRSLLDHPDRQGNGAEGYTHEEIGECLLLLHREAEAAPHFLKAYALLGVDPWLEANEPERLARLQRLGEGGGVPR